LAPALPVSACASVCPHGFRCSKHGSRAPQALSSASDGVRLAVSFPTISKLLPFLRIPTIVFFIGKHFGAGVILATAFIHLLDDAFRSLQGPEVAAAGDYDTFVCD
ncbi:hypothetical protein BJ912DRAFT_95002, partial [Pholiota molesta]